MKDFLVEYKTLVPRELKDLHRGFAYDAVWAMALALNRTIPRLAPGTSLDKVPYGDKAFTNTLTDALKETNFYGVTVSN